MCGHQNTFVQIKLVLQQYSLKEQLLNEGSARSTENFLSLEIEGIYLQRDLILVLGEKPLWATHSMSLNDKPKWCLPWQCFQSTRMYSSMPASTDTSRYSWEV